MARTVIMDHPLIQHKIGIIRKKDTSSKEFREMISEIAMLMCYEATRELPLTDVEIETPICKTTVKELEGKKMAVVPILRAGLGMVCLLYTSPFYSKLLSKHESIVTWKRKNASG